MALAKTSSGAKIATILVLIPIGMLLWVAAPYVLPMWRWQNIEWSDEWNKIAKKSDIPLDKLRTEYRLQLRYAPRGGNKADPMPWQIVKSTPSFIDVFPDSEYDETGFLVRCSIISERDGTPPSSLWVGTAQDEKYFNITAWRFPPGTFGLGGGKRPVLVYKGGTLDPISIGEGGVLNEQVKGWENDDLWESRNDGFGQ